MVWETAVLQCAPRRNMSVTQAYQAWRKERPIETPFHSFSIRDLPEFWRE